MDLARRGLARSGDVARVVDGAAVAHVAAERAEIVDRAVPVERVVRAGEAGGRGSRHVAVRVNVPRDAEHAADGAEVGHRAPIPHEGVTLPAHGGPTPARDLARGIDAAGMTVEPAERAEVVHRAVPQEAVLTAGGAVARPHDVAARIDGR